MDIKLNHSVSGFEKKAMSPQKCIIVNQQVVCVSRDTCSMIHLRRYKPHSLEGIPRVTLKPLLAQTLAFDLLNGRKTIEEVLAIAYCIGLQN
uniref:Uncharacterized protein n=1 Tax=viral metagenome TaxID=1070528 RepID=A0A6C0AHG0_9ZZZZ